MKKWIIILSGMFAVILLVMGLFLNTWSVKAESGEFPKSIRDGQWEFRAMGDGMYQIRSSGGKYQKMMRCE